MKQNSVAYSVLMDSKNTLTSNLVGIAFCWSKNKVYYLDYLKLYNSKSFKSITLDLIPLV